MGRRGSTSNAGGGYTDVAPKLNASSMQQAVDSAKRSLPIQLRAVTPSAANSNPYVQQSLPVITLPDNAKVLGGNGGNTVSLVVPATNFGQGWARAGSGTLGPLAGNASVGASQYAATASGDLVFNATDAWTSVDIGYLPNRYDVVNATYTCTSGSGVVAGLPTGIIFILEAEVLVGGSTGGKIVFFPNSTAPSAGQCRLSLGKTGVFFAIADAATSVRLKLGVIPASNY